MVSQGAGFVPRGIEAGEVGMSWYWAGILFTMGAMIAAEENTEDNWKYGLAFLFLALMWPLYWGMRVGFMLKKREHGE